MEKEIFSILDSKNTAKIFALRPDDRPALHLPQREIARPRHQALN
jgi:hypothetical protein